VTLSQALTDRVRELLLEKGWSQRKLAHKLGITQGAISFMLSGKRRNDGLGYYERLARIFGFPLSEFCRQLEVRATPTMPPLDMRYHLAEPDASGRRFFQRPTFE
jgi:transcriptional regulator with XRE-family HTH domain